MKRFKNKKSKLTIIVTFISFLVLGVIGFSYAYYKLQVEGAITTNTISLGKLDLNFLNTNTLNITDSLPIYESNRYTEAPYIGFTVDGSATDFEGCYQLVLDITQIDEELKDETFKWEFYDETNQTTLFSGNFEHNSDINDISLMAFQSLTLETNHTYKVLIYIAWDSAKDQTAMMGKTFKARIKATSIMGGCFDGQDATILAYTFSGGGQAPTSFPTKGQGYRGTSVECTGAEGATWDNISWGVSFEGSSTLITPIMCRVNFEMAWPNCSENSNKLNCNILADNPEYETQIVVNDTMFASVAVSQEYYDTLTESTAPKQSQAIVQGGLWTENRAGKTEDDLPTYFYRGDIDNNYVSFAGKMWRIVRINEDGSVKLILGGNSTTDGYGGTTTTFNPSYSGVENLNYNHVNNALRVTNLDWYANDTKGNLDAYESYIADTKFCNDKLISSRIGNQTYYGSYGRITSNTPQYKCQYTNDNLIYKIGALTADEVVYAGGSRSANNASYYLYDNAQSSDLANYWLLLSPSYYNYYSNYAYVFIVNVSTAVGALSLNLLDQVYNFRPVISLKSFTQILRGDGTQGNPYVITESGN